MKIMRTVYHIDGKDFEEYNTVSFNFFVPPNSVQSFKELCADKGVRILKISAKNKESERLVETKSYPINLTMLAHHLGVRGHNELRNGWNLTHSILRKERFGYKHLGYSVYNPQTKTTELRSNSPFVIKGNQQVFSGKLWRRINTKKL